MQMPRAAVRSSIDFREGIVRRLPMDAKRRVVSLRETHRLLVGGRITIGENRRIARSSALETSETLRLEQVSLDEAIESRLPHHCQRRC